jgi:hypothetical protein
MKISVINGIKCEVPESEFELHGLVVDPQRYCLFLYLDCAARRLEWRIRSKFGHDRFELGDVFWLMPWPLRNNVIVSLLQELAPVMREYCDECHGRRNRIADIIGKYREREHDDR